MEFKNIALPINVLEEINSPEVKQYILTELTDAHNTRRELEKANTTVKEQEAYIAELEKQVSLLQKTLDVIHQNKCKVKKSKPICKKRRELQGIEIIVRENNDMPYEFPATVGVKCYTKGKPYGLFNGFGKPELTVAEVVETANLLIEEILGRWRNGRL